MARSARFSLDTSTSTRPSRYGQIAGLKLRIHEDISEARARARQLASISRKTGKSEFENRCAGDFGFRQEKRRSSRPRRVSWLDTIAASERSTIYLISLAITGTNVSEISPGNVSIPVESGRKRRSKFNAEARNTRASIVRLNFGARRANESRQLVGRA